MKFVAGLVLYLLCSFSFAQNITAKSFLVADGDGKTIISHNAEDVRAIASITKLMTAIVVLDAKQDLNEFIKPYTRRELIKLALVSSDNKAANTLCEKYPGGMARCLTAMNTKARSLGMEDTNFVDSTGLGSLNVSTANDLVKLVMEASKYKQIVEDSSTSQVKIQISKKWWIFNNTNPIIGKRHEFIVSKTGYIKASGGCVVMMLNTDKGQRIVVVLGSKDTKTRIPEAELIGLTN